MAITCFSIDDSMRMKFVAFITISFLSLCLLVSACQPTSDSAILLESRFFDLKGYFEQEIQRLGEKGKAQKQVMVDGKKEERGVDSVDFRKELNVFASSDINRPAWSDAYKVDSVFNKSGEVLRLGISALDKNLKAQQITIDYFDRNVSKIFIENVSKNPITTAIQRLTYMPSAGYIIESHQDIHVGGEHDFKVEVHFIR